MRLWRSRRDAARRASSTRAASTGACGTRWPSASTALRLHIPDLRGHGSTPLPPGEYSHAEDLLRMLDDLRHRARHPRGRLVRRLGRAAAGDQGARARQRRWRCWPRPAATATTRSGRRRSSPSARRRTRCWRPATSRARWRSACASGSRAPAVRDLVEEMTRDAFELQQGVEAQERPLPVDLGSHRGADPGRLAAARTRCPTSPGSPISSPPRSPAPSAPSSRTPGTSSPSSAPTPPPSCSRPWLERVSA